MGDVCVEKKVEPFLGILYVGKIKRKLAGAHHETWAPCLVLTWWQLVNDEWACAILLMLSSMHSWLYPTRNPPELTCSFFIGGMGNYKSQCFLGLKFECDGSLKGELRFCELISKDEIAVWGHDLTIIRCQKLSQQVDKAVWKPAKNGLFTISSCYEFLRVKHPKLETSEMGGRGRQRKKDPPPKGGVATKITDLKDDNGEQNSISVEETNKEQTEVVKLVARDPNQMGLEIEKSELLSPDLGEKERDAEGILLDLAGSTQGQRKSGFDAGPRDGRADKGKRQVDPVERKGVKGKKGVRLETQPSVIQMKQPSGEKDAGSTSGTAMPPSARWSDLIEKEKREFQLSLKQKPLRSWASVVEGNRDISKGWDLQYIKPQDPTGAVVITEDEWVKGSKIWENALVGYVLGSKLDFKDVANFVNNRWREFQVPKAFMLRNGVFLFDFGDGDAKQAVLERRWTFNGHPLILKQWTPDFDPDNLDISKIPAWIQFPELHLSLWNPKSLGKLTSYVGVPIATDALTAKRQRVAYACMLVEMEIMDTLPRVVPIIGPKGVFQQPVVFEWEPVRCGKCRNLGHEEKNCTTKEKKVWVPKKPAEEQVVKQIVGTKSSEGNDELCGGEVQTAINSANVKQSTLSRPSGKLIVERNEQSLGQLEVGAMKSVNLQSETSVGTGDKEMMQKVAGGESSVNLRVTEVIQTDQLLHVEVCSAVGDVKFLCTIVYAFNTFDGRVALWDQVRALDVENVPWIISGDFNTTLNYGERVKPGGVVWGDTSELKDFVNRMEVFDLQFSCAYFTWSNKQRENDRLWCKLDRVMANTTWVSAFPNTSVVFLNPQSSDHSPSLVSVDVLMNEKPRPFRFFNAWSKDENFLDMVREAWSVDIQGCPMFVVLQKLKLVKQKMKQLHKNRYGNLEGRIKDMTAELQNVQASMQNALFDETLAAKEKELQRELTKLERANLSHRSVINSILNCEGVRVTQPKLIEQEFLMFYRNLFGKAKEGVQVVDMNVIHRGRMLTTEESEELCRPFTTKEVEIALFSIPSNKSPGPDGFTSGFYRAAWSIIKNDVMAAVLDFFYSGKILKQINATNITIVPKVSCPNVVSDYRPIACYNVIYKAISKLLTQRINEVLSMLVSSKQTAFVKGRSITKNLLICQDLVRNYHRSRGPARCLMKIDLQKAYDSVDWGFVNAMLRGLNFPDRFINWLMLCISTTRFSVLINGQPKGYFQGQRGLRQGDPISPYLFVLVMEYLTRKLKELDMQEKFKYHSKCRVMQLTHLIFADDIMLFCKADEESTVLMMQKFEQFGRVSRLEVNRMKSQVFFSGVREGQKVALIQKLGFAEGQLPVEFN
ncbi:hypothetical protein SLEP1_g11364 [Rubroshorea leprosula]|uniref:Reverse transcriptase domain-containing protein n=1 Tax=Rubroshorea leprosula TaxID=152421 RepID=A0AAV5IMG5_9ROSI|nr:hypothetical protein SLEP1_g11364 [Rubroshorea leprosula]